MSGGVLFVHNNFPSQFGALAKALVARGVPCASIGQSYAPGVPGVDNRRYKLPRGSTPGILPLATRAEADLIRAIGAVEAARPLRDSGFSPKVIVAHPGWGESLLLRELFPDAAQVVFHEFYYRGHGLDVGFDSTFGAATEVSAVTADMKNLSMSMALAHADEIVSPTQFQASTLPPRLQEGVRIIHEGVDTKRIYPARAEPFVVDEQLTIQPGVPVITHVNRNLEPMRGLHIFARALPRLQAAIPNARVLIIGTAKTRGYGGEAPDGATWRDTCFAPVQDQLDHSRIHFLGHLPPERLLAALRLSTAHVYYSYPFVLSWSLTEAMAAGCYIIGSDTAPLHDAITDGVNGRLLPFFDVDALSDAMIAACRNPDGQAGMRAAARATAVERFDAAKGVEAWLKLLAEMGVDLGA